jgi:hypothetical protein
MSLAHALTYSCDRTPGTGPDRPDSVKEQLTPEQPRRPVENDEYAAFIGRILNAYSRRIAAGDIDALADMADLASQMETVTRDAVKGLRQRGYSWAEIGTRLGITRQAAQQRWGSQ